MTVIIKESKETKGEKEGKSSEKMKKFLRNNDNPGNLSSTSLTRSIGSRPVLQFSHRHRSPGIVRQRHLMELIINNNGNT